MFLLLDRGTWGGAATKTANTINFAEGSFVVDGKTGLLATYVMYVGNHRERKYLAHLYVVLEAAQGTYGRPTSLMATVIGRNAKAMDIARRIFQSIRFPTATPNKSLDRSGGSVFCNLIGRAKVE
jgi:hypothetical protein